MPHSDTATLMARAVDMALRLQAGQTLSVQWIETHYGIGRRSAYRLFNDVKRFFTIESDVKHDGQGSLFWLANRDHRPNLDESETDTMMSRAIDITLRLHAGETLNVRWLQDQYGISRRSAYRLLNDIKTCLQVQSKKTKDGRGCLFWIAQEAQAWPESAAEAANT